MKTWTEQAVSRYKTQNGGKLEPKEATKEDLEAIIKQIDRLKKKVKSLQHIADLMEPEP